jgi:hypothetical protein
MGEMYALDYVRDFMKKLEIRANPRPLVYVHARLLELLRYRSLPDSLRIEHQDEIEQVSASLWDLEDEVIASCDGKPFTIGQLLLNFPYLPREARVDMKSMLGYAIRDQYITEEAKRMGFEEDPDVRLQAKLFEEYLVSRAYRRKLVRDLKVTEAEVRDYYEQKKDRYKAAPVLDIVEITCLKDMLARELMALKRSRVSTDKFRELTREMVIQRDYQAIHDYYANTVYGDRSMATN